MTVLNWRRWFRLLCSAQCTDLAAAPKMSKIVKMLERGDGVARNGRP
jgi:hypothetical protein